MGAQYTRMAAMKQTALQATAIRLPHTILRRVYADIDNEGMCGNYEGETAQMMARAFKESRCLDYEKTR